MKKWISLVCAAAMVTGGVSALPVNAEKSHYMDYITIFNLDEGANGSAIVSTVSHAHYSFIAVTDGTEHLEAKDFDNQILDVSLIPTDTDTFLSTWDVDSVKRLTQNGNHVNYYCISVKSTGNMEKDLPLIARRFMLENPEVKDTYFYDIFSSATESFWNGRLTMWNKDSSTTEQRQQFAAAFENTEEQTFEKIKQDYTEQTAKCKALLEGKNLTEEEKQALRQFYGMPTDYEMLKPVFDFAKHIEKTYPDVIEIAVPEIEWTSGKSSFSITESYKNASSSWEGIGDINEDGDVNAKDASDILCMSVSVSTENNQNSDADINADGEINAKDAALVLQYSTQKGYENFSGTLAEFVKSKS